MQGRKVVQNGPGRMTTKPAILIYMYGKIRLKSSLQNKNVRDPGFGM